VRAARYPSPLKRRRAKKGERGFALLLIFLLASAIALMLYRQMPREAFESERDKEQMLIDRGEQYKRAIYLYYAQNNRQWPARIEDLENTNNHRYLRHRYIDPYTGKDEWRLVHTNGVFLTDSLVTPAPTQGAPGAPGTAPLGGTGTLASSPANSTTTSSDPDAPPEVNAQVARRASDRTLVQNSNFQNLPGSFSSQSNDPGYQPFNPAALPPISLYPNGYNAAPVNAPGANAPVVQGFQPGQLGFNLPGTIQGGVNQPGVNQAGGSQAGVNPGQLGVPGFLIPGTNTPITNPGVNAPNFNPTSNPALGGNQQAGNPNQPIIAGIQPPVVPGSNLPFPTQQFPVQPFPGQNQQNLPGNVQGFGAAPIGAPGIPGAPNNNAINMINQLLTTPRQAPTTVGQNQPASGGGLAGVASTYKGVSIKSYGDRTKYQEWEFVFQLNTQGTLQSPMGLGANGRPVGSTPGGPLDAPGVPGLPGATGPGGATPGGTAPGSTSPGGTTGGANFGFGTN
jgi:hypothetical protein